ncbi:DUF3626 domain-containing protein [Microlunatus parietis]
MRVTLNFHPDRLVGDRTVIECLAEERSYRSQFETKISNGGLTAYPGGARWRWEQRSFGGAYDDAPPESRPRYGALNHRGADAGGAIRFGSCHLRLTESVLDRSTFCFPDSVFDPTDYGTAAHCDLAALADAFHDRPHTDLSEGTEGGRLDSYIEAHVHGPVLLDRDVEAIVLDPSFRGTEVEQAARLAHPVIEWTAGRILSVAELQRHPDFRGPEPLIIGPAVAEHDQITARMIGVAARSDRYDPQVLKKLWHLVARFGLPT